MNRSMTRSSGEKSLVERAGTSGPGPGSRAGLRFNGCSLMWNALKPVYRCEWEVEVPEANKIYTPWLCSRSGQVAEGSRGP